MNISLFRFSQRTSRLALFRHWYNRRLRMPLVTNGMHPASSCHEPASRYHSAVFNTVSLTAITPGILKAVVNESLVGLTCALSNR